MRQWWMCTSGRASDPSWSALSLAARGLLATLEDSAASTSTAKQNTADKVQLPPGGLDAYLSTVARGRAIKTAREALAELSAAGWFVVDGSELVLRGRVDGPPAQRAKAAPTLAPRSSDTLRADRYYFNRRERAFRDFPPDLTWEAWVATSEGRAYLDGAAPRPPVAPVAMTPSGGVATEPATPLQRPPATHGTPANAGFLDVAGEKIEREDTHTTRARAHTREGDSEEPGEPETAEVDPARVVENIERRSGGKLTLKTYGDTRPMRAFGDAVRAAVAAGTPVDLIERIGDHAAHGGYSWRNAPVDLTWLARDLSRQLLTVETCSGCNPKPDEWDVDPENEKRRRAAANDPWEAARAQWDRENPRWREFLAGSGGRIPPATEKIHAAVENALRNAGVEQAYARELGAYACNPKAWASTCRDIDTRRPPTLQELVNYNCAALAACIASFNAASRAAAEQERRLLAEQENARNTAEHIANARAAREATSQGRPLFKAFLDGIPQGFNTHPTTAHADAVEATLRAAGLDAEDAPAVARSTVGVGGLRSPMRRILSLDELTADDCAELRAAIERHRTRAA